MSSTELLKVNNSGLTLLSRQYRFVCPTAIAVYIFLQLAIGFRGNLCDSGDAHLSTRAYYFYTGGSSSFVVSAINQIIKIVECRSQHGDRNAEGIYVAVFTVNALAATSFILTFTLNWGGICTDVLGVQSTSAQWAEWLVTVPLMVYMVLAMEDKRKLSREDKIIIFVFSLAIGFGFLLNFRSMPASLGYLMFVLGCCSISVSVLLDYFTTRKYRIAVCDENYNRNNAGTLARASKRRTLTRLFLIVFPCFPLTHILAQAKLIDREGTFIGYALCSLIAKLLFASSVSDTHINLIEGINKLILIAEMTANQSRRMFLQTVFTDVRMSINEVSASLDLLKFDKQHELNVTSREALTMMKGAANFIHDVISLQKVECEKFNLVIESFSMEELVQTALAEVKVTSDAKRISIVVQSTLDGHTGIGSASSDPCRVIDVHYVGDKLRLIHVVVTFLSNAIKYSPTFSQITLRLTGSYRDSENNAAQKLAQMAAARHHQSHFIAFCRNSLFSFLNSDTEATFHRNDSGGAGQTPSDVCELSLVVIDNGVGISSDAVANLFTPYSHRNTDHIQANNTGLKLMIAKEIIALHGGEVIVESMVGRGSTFGFCIPFNVEFKVTNRSDSFHTFIDDGTTFHDGSLEWRQPNSTSCKEADSNLQIHYAGIERQSLSHMTARSQRCGLSSLIVDGTYTLSLYAHKLQYLLM